MIRSAHAARCAGTRRASCGVPARIPASLLGPRELTRYYEFAAEQEHVWVAEHDGTIVGGCVLTDDPAGQLKRFVRAAPVKFAKAMGGSLLSSRALRRRLVSRSSPGEAHAPEVTQIFTDGKVRGKGLGAQLLRTCEATLRTRGVRKYFVHTQRDDNAAGIRFYRREGFVQIGESRSFGEAFLVMQKDL